MHEMYLAGAPEDDVAAGHRAHHGAAPGGGESWGAWT